MSSMRAVVALLATLASHWVLADVTGEFTITTDTQPMGKVVSKLIIRADRTGHMSNHLGTYELEDIYIDGNSFEFEIVADTPWGDRTVTYVGTVEGDKVSGDRLSDMGNSTFAGTRVKQKEKD